MRLGVMGGTFNPIHYGHLAAANEVCEAFALDTVVFVPAAVPPHKDLAAITDPRHRLVMTMLATISHPHFAVSSVEIDRPGASYTVDTVAQLKDLTRSRKLSISSWVSTRLPTLLPGGNQMCCWEAVIPS